MRPEQLTFASSCQYPVLDMIGIPIPPPC